MMRYVAGFLLILGWYSLVGTAQADDQTMLDRAIAGAIGQFNAALPALGRSSFGVDVVAYRDALTLHQFSGGTWTGQVEVQMVMRPANKASCSQFAAYVRLPPQDGIVPLALCPQFFSPGADALRQLTILHEMVHVVRGRDECQAMAFAAQIEHAATGRHTPVDAYWLAENCAATPYRLP